jgi:hypothetical protein
MSVQRGDGLGVKGDGLTVLPVGALSGRHHELPRANAERMTGAQAGEMMTINDSEWILAAAMLDSLTDDLAITHAAKWWTLNPDEMQGKCGEADLLLKELHSDGIATLMDMVAAATAGRVQMRLGWLLRVAKSKAKQRSLISALSFESVRHRIRLVETGLQARIKVDSDAVSGSPRYQRERFRARKQAGLCRECSSQVEPGHSRCPECRRIHRLSEEKRKEQRRKLPAGAISLREWMLRMADKLHLTIKGVQSRMTRGAIVTPPVVYRNHTRVYVMPLEGGAGQGDNQTIRQGERRAAA